MSTIRRKKIYEGKAKILYEGPEPGTLIQYFKDDATAFNAQKKAVLEGKGVINNRISEFIMSRLNGIGVTNHFIKRLNLREQLIREVEIIPLEVVCRNIVAGSMSQRLGIEEGTPLPRSIIEFYYKKDELNDPMVTEEHITAFNAQKKAVLEGKGVINNRISEYVMVRLNGIGVQNHFIRRLSLREQLIKEVEIIPLEVVCRNIAAGSLAQRLGLPEGQPLPRSIIEFYYKDDKLGDPLVTEEHITAFNWASTQEIDDIMAMTLRINDFLCGMFGGVGITLVDF
ncbi:MAG: phosphoribosylaminoimidazolesuccinocarboxamide synthase, partial [Caulobacteraceae bacterium]